MILDNRSSFSTATLRKLTNFVAKKCRLPELAHIRVYDGRGEGLAYKSSPYKDTPTVSCVEIWLKDGPFPKVNCYRKRAGKMKIYSWEEEYVLILAHELRHIDQFWTKMPRFYEVDAERFAMDVLKTYRVKHPAPKKAARKKKR